MEEHLLNKKFLYQVYLWYTVRITTIKIKAKTKAWLDDFKEESKSYDEVIVKLMQKVVAKNLKQRLIEGYKSIGKEDIKFLEEWENASRELQDGS